MANMRWLFCNPDDTGEMAAKQAVLEKIDAWWRAFSAKTADLTALFCRAADWDLPQWMHDHLQAIHPQLMWEFGPAVKTDGHRLVITPEAERHLRPMVGTIIERAPRIPGWEFYPYRLREGLEQARLTVAGRADEDISDWRAAARVGEHGLIDVAYYSPRCAGPEDRAALNAAFVATESLLGEEVLDKWVGKIEVQVAPRKRLLGVLGKPRPGNLIALDRLPPTVDSLVGSLIDQLPPRPFCAADPEEAAWTSIELEAPEMPDYPGRRDLFVATTAILEMWQAAHSGGLFRSSRFSRCGEIFCYLKMEHTEQFNCMDLGRRTEVEDALDAALRPNGLGAVCGSGTGKRYGYLDLALTDLNRSVPICTQVLRETGVSQRSWILFFDADLCEEWVGAHDATPAPPQEAAG